MIKAKFRVQSILHHATESPNDSLATIKLHPVWADGKGNESWSKATPQGSIEMLITNPAAIAGFDLGASYYVTFTKA